MSRIIVGVGGGIAAYKACTVVRQLAEAGHSVRVVPTESALQFVGAATFEALSGEPARTGVFDDVPEVPHVRLGQDADLVVVAPATADLLSRAATGRADDLLTATLLTATCPVLFAPRCIRRCGCIRQPSRMSRPCGAVARLSWSPPLAA
ncbi:flavofamily protein [Mycobacteroides abscessus MAB_030201_1061]|nr:flavofamily protein [Mycobacteroides abscessus MAB_030201_1061]